MSSGLVDPHRTQQEARETELRPDAPAGRPRTGVVVEDEYRRIAHANAHFRAMSGLPDGPAGADGPRDVREIGRLFADPDGYVARVEHLRRERRAVAGEVLCLADGRVWERDYIPLRSGDQACV